jgi:hypothetical protein
MGELLTSTITVSSRARSSLQVRSVTNLTQSSDSVTRILILPHLMLDTSFLVATILVVITLLFYILYWGRFLALLIGLVFRVVLWNRGGSSAWIQIGALPVSPCPFTFLMLESGSFHVSLLAGRILLKDFRYHSSNQTFKIVKVQLRWQYWIRSLTHSEDIQSHGGSEGPKCAPTLFFLPSALFQTQSQLATFPGHRAVASTRHLKALSGLSTIGRLHLTISSHGWKQTYPSRNVAPKLLVPIGLSPI